MTLKEMEKCIHPLRTCRCTSSTLCIFFMNQIIIKLDVTEKNARGTIKCVYPGAFPFAKGSHSQIPMEKNVKMGIF